MGDAEDNDTPDGSSSARRDLMALAGRFDSLPAPARSAVSTTPIEGRLDDVTKPPLGAMSLADLAAASETARDQAQLDRLKLVVIHGWGSSFLDAIAGIEALLRFRAAYRDGVFFVHRHDGLVLRRLFAIVDPDIYVRAFQKLGVSRLLAACFETAQLDETETIEFNERRIINDFGHLGIPTGPQSRCRRATQLQVEALVELEPIMPVIAELKSTFKKHDGCGRLLWHNARLYPPGVG